MSENIEQVNFMCFFACGNSNHTEITDLSIVIVTVENKDELIPNVNIPELILNEDVSKMKLIFQEIIKILITSNRIT